MDGLKNGISRLALAACRFLQQNRHQTDMPSLLSDVRCWGQSGKHLLAASISPFDPGRVETFFVPPKTASNRARWTSTRPSEHIFAVSSLESIRAQPRTMLSDLNGHTARTTVHAPQARIAATSGLIPTMFITRVRRGSDAFLFVARHLPAGIIRNARADLSA